MGIQSLEYNDHVIFFRYRKYYLPSTDSHKEFYKMHAPSRCPMSETHMLKFVICCIYQNPFYQGFCYPESLIKCDRPNKKGKRTSERDNSIGYLGLFSTIMCSVILPFFYDLGLINLLFARSFVLLKFCDAVKKPSFSSRPCICVAKVRREEDVVLLSTSVELVVQTKQSKKCIGVIKWQ